VKWSSEIQDLGLTVYCRNPLTAQRVKSIIVSLDFLASQVKRPAPRLTFVELWTPGAFMKPFVRYFEGTSRDFSAHLPQLRHLEVGFNSIPSSYLSWYPITCRVFRSAAQKALHSVASNLRSLHLNIPLEAYRDDFFDSTTYFPRLEELKLSLRAMYLSTMDEEIMKTRLVPLIMRHSSTLTSLALLVDQGEYAPYGVFVKTDKFFRELPLLAKLKTLSIRVYVTGPSQTSLTGVSKFIKQQARGLVELDLELPIDLPRISNIYRPYTMEIMLAESLLTHSIPSCSQLTHLTTVVDGRYAFPSLVKRKEPALKDGDCVKGWFEGVARPLKQGLVQLRLPHTDFAEDVLLKMLGSVQFYMLVEAEFRINTVTMALFDGMEGSLPKLKKLGICANELQGRSGRSCEGKVRLQFLFPHEPRRFAED